MLNSLNCWKLAFLGPIHEFLWPTILICDFLNFQIKEIVFCLLNHALELFPILNLFGLSIGLEISVTILIPPLL